jgi:H-NS histone family
MAERGNEKMTEWLDIKLDTLSSEERIHLIEEICDTLTPQELRTIRDLAEQLRHSKIEEAKAAVLEEMTGRLEELGLSITDVLPKRGKKRKNTSPPKQVKYRGQNGET